MTDLVEFRAAGEQYAVDARQVLDVFAFQPPTPVPCTPPYVVGVVSHRGLILPLIDLGLLLEQSAEATPRHVVALRSEDLRFGLLAEEVAGMTRSDAAVTVLDPGALAAERRLVIDDGRVDAP